MGLRRLLTFVKKDYDSEQIKYGKSRFRHETEM